MSHVSTVMIRNNAVETLKQRGAQTWQRLARGRSVAVRHFLLRQLHIQATPQLYPPEFTGLNNCDQGASWARPVFFTGRQHGLSFRQCTLSADNPPGLI